MTDSDLLFIMAAVGVAMPGLIALTLYVLCALIGD